MYVQKQDPAKYYWNSSIIGFRQVIHDALNLNTNKTNHSVITWLFPKRFQIVVYYYSHSCMFILISECVIFHQYNVWFYRIPSHIDNKWMWSINQWVGAVITTHPSQMGWCVLFCYPLWRSKKLTDLVR